MGGSLLRGDGDDDQQRRTYKIAAMEKEENRSRMRMLILVIIRREGYRKVNIEVYRRVFMCLVSAGVFVVGRIYSHAGQSILSCSGSGGRGRVRETDSHGHGCLSHGAISEFQG